jgi:hypothetical protein
MKYQIIVTSKDKPLFRMTFDNLDFAKYCFARILPELSNSSMELQEVKIISSSRANLGLFIRNSRHLTLR